MKGVGTFTATIYVGTRVGRSTEPGWYHSIHEIDDVCQEYCDEVGLCVTVTPTRFIYTKGSEPGCAIGLISYPRFPADQQTIRNHALTLAERLRRKMEQCRVSVVMPDETVMLGNRDTPA